MRTRQNEFTKRTRKNDMGTECMFSFLLSGKSSNCPTRFYSTPLNSQGPGSAQGNLPCLGRPVYVHVLFEKGAFSSPATTSHVSFESTGQSDKSKQNQTTVKLMRQRWTQLDHPQSLVIFARHNKETNHKVKSLHLMYLLSPQGKRAKVKNDRPRDDSICSL